MQLSTICDSLDSGVYLRLIDGCFSIVKGEKILSTLCCFKDLYSPVDGYNNIQQIIPNNGSYTIFDNRFDNSPSNTLVYQSRGFILYVNYPDNDINGLPVHDEYLNLILRFTNNQNVEFDIPFYKFYSMLQNPITQDHNNLVNKVELINPNNYDVSVNILSVLVNRDGSSPDNTLLGC